MRKDRSFGFRARASLSLGNPSLLQPDASPNILRRQRRHIALLDDYSSIRHYKCILNSSSLKTQSGPRRFIRTQVRHQPVDFRVCLSTRSLSLAVVVTQMQLLLR